MIAFIILFGCASALFGSLPSQANGPSGSKATPASGNHEADGKRPGAKKSPTDKPIAQASDAAKTLLDKIQRYYDSTRDYSAEFSQVYTRVALSKTSESSGRVLIKKPGMMRWEYKRPAEKLFVADGTKLYVYEPDEGQVIIDPNFKTATLSTSISFLFGDGRLSDAFVATVGDASVYQAPKGSEALELVPKKDATYTKLVLVLDPKTNQVIESILFETSGNTNRFRFKNPTLNTGIKDDVFKFTPPPGVEIIQR